MKHQNLYISIVIILLAAGAIAFLLRRHVTLPTAPVADATATAAQQTPATSQDLKVNFQCDDNKSMAATFHLSANMLDLMLSDGRVLTLTNVPSSDSTQYISTDGTIRLWSKGQGTFLQEGDKTTFSNCSLENGPMGTPVGQ